MAAVYFRIAILGWIEYVSSFPVYRAEIEKQLFYTLSRRTISCVVGRANNSRPTFTTAMQRAKLLLAELIVIVVIIVVVQSTSFKEGKNVRGNCKGGQSLLLSFL